MKERYTATTTGRRTIGVVVFAMGLSLAGAAQQRPGDLVYRFSVEGINDPVAAKPFQVAMLDHPSVYSLPFIDDCHCFKLATAIPLDRQDLANLISSFGYQLRWPVVVSDGTEYLGPATIIGEQ